MSTSRNKLRLSNPNPYGTYLLADGSIIYRSGLTPKPSPGRYFLFISKYDKRYTKSKENLLIGEILVERGGITYFSSPDSALDALTAITDR